MKIARSVVFALFGTLAIQAASILPDDSPKSQFAPGWEKYQQGISELAKGQLKDAELSLKASLALDAHRPGTFVGLGEIAFKLGNRDAAHEYFDRALMEAPADYGVLLSYARIRIAEKNLVAAENLLRRAMQANGKAAEPYVYLGDVYTVMNHQPREGLALYQQAIGLDINSAPAHYRAGLALLEMKQTEAAITELDKAAKLTNGDATPATRLGAVYLEQKAYTKAIDAFNLAIKAQPSYALAYLGRADAHSLRKDYDSAIRDYQTAIRIAPESAQGHLRLGMLYHDNGKLDDAREQYLKTIALDKKSAPAFNNLAAISSERKQNLDQAVVWAKSAVDLQPGLVEYADTLAWVYHARGENQKAQAIFRGIASRTDNAEIQYHAGIVMQELGDVIGARSAYQSALRRNPAFNGSDDAKRRVAALAAK